MNNYKIEISYDGSLFHGFQKQLNVRTVQSEIEDSLKLITQNYELNYAGRTDAGVHARSQIISLKTIDNLEPSFFNSLDSLLGDEIKIKKFQKVRKNFKNFSKLRKGQDPFREISKSEWSKTNDYFVYTIEGSSFLHNMVRAIVGCQLALQESKITKKELKESLERPRGERFNFIAPAHGLYLWKIKY